MARPYVSPAVLADKGVPLTLGGDLNVTLCFSFKALMLLEDRYGSLEEAAALMGGAKPTVADAAGVQVPNPEGAGAKPFRTVAGILACGLAHEVTPPEDDGRPLDDLEVLADYLESDQIAVYSDAIAEAFDKAFPTEDPTPPAGGEKPAKKAAASRSRGARGTGSPASGSGSAKTSSGA